jgi:hypothetical protein
MISLYAVCGDKVSISSAGLCVEAIPPLDTPMRKSLRVDVSFNGCEAFSDEIIKEVLGFLKPLGIGIGKGVTILKYVFKDKIVLFFIPDNTDNHHKNSLF